MTLNEFFAAHPKCALGFSGGVDSAYLLYAGVRAGADIRPYYIKTAFQPRFEQDDALRLAGELGVEVTVLELDALADPRVAANPAERCYYCKQNLFRALKARAAADGYAVLLDGTNASDEAGDRPGMRALRELEVRSPPAGVRPDQSGYTPPVQGGGPVHLGQTGLRLSGHPASHGGRSHGGSPGAGGGGGGRPVPPGLRRLPGAGVPRGGAAPASGRAAGAGRPGAGRPADGSGPLFQADSAGFGGALNGTESD